MAYPPSFSLWGQLKCFLDGENSQNLYDGFLLDKTLSIKTGNVKKYTQQFLKYRTIKLSLSDDLKAMDMITIYALTDSH